MTAGESGASSTDSTLNRIAAGRSRTWLFPPGLHLFIAMLAAPTAVCWFVAGRTGLGWLYLGISVSNGFLSRASASERTTDHTSEARP